MNYEAFKKQAGFGDAMSWLGQDLTRSWNNMKGYIGISSPTSIMDPFNAKDHMLWQPFDPNGNQKIENQYQNAYQQPMDAYQKMDQLQKDVRYQVNKNIPFVDVGSWLNPFGRHDKDIVGAAASTLQNYGINVEPFNPTAWWDTARKTWKNITGNREESAFDKLRDGAILSNDSLNAADRFINASNIDDVDTYLQNVDSMASSMPNSEAASAFKQYITDGLQSRVWDEVKANPIQNIPKAASLFLRQHGLGVMADFAKNPIAFYGSLIGILGGGAMLLGGSDSESQPITINNHPGYNKVPYS